MHSFREALFLLFSIPFYSVLIGVEILFSNWQHKEFYSLKSTLENALFTILNAGLDLLLRGFFYVSILIWCYHLKLFQIENVFSYWFLLFILEDLTFYIEHKIDHFCRIFWAIHATHHSSEDFNLTTGFRSSVLQPVYRFIYFIPIALMGFEPLDILFMYLLTQTYRILVHTQYVNKMPVWFEAVFVSPAHHRVHHASNIIYLDKNMGMCLIIWDRMFGTFQNELEDEPIAYGLTKPIPKTKNPAKWILHEWFAIENDLRRKIPVVTKLKYLFMPRGWSHDGSTKTTAELKKSFKNNNPKI